MTETAIIFDCEFLTAPGAPGRFWCGPRDPDPVAAQIGAVRLALTDEAEILDSFSQVIRPVDRKGDVQSVDPFFAKLTGVSDDRIATEGVDLAAALTAFDAFSEGAPFWSWGKDEFNLLAISCYVAGVDPVIPAHRFGNAARLMLAAGVPEETIFTLRSPGLPAFFGIETEGLRPHDALGDAMSVALSLRHLIRKGDLSPAALADPRGPQVS